MRGIMNGSASPRWPITICNFGKRSNTPPSTMRRMCMPVSMCQPQPGPAIMKVVAG